MEANEIKDALEGIKKQVETKSTEQATELKSMIETLEAKMEAKQNGTIEGLKVELKAVQDYAEKLDAKLQEAKTETKDGDFLSKSISDNIEAIKNVKKGSSFETKAVGNMTISNVSGSTPKTYNLDIVTLPAQTVNLEDLARPVMADNGTYVFTRELAGEGSIAANSEGAAKSQRDYDFEAIDVVTNFIAGFARYSKKMRKQKNEK